MLYEAIEERRADPLASVRDDALSLLGAGDLRGRIAARGPGGPRRAADPADGRLRDDHERASPGAFERLLRSPEKLLPRCSQRARARRRAPTSTRWCKETLRTRPVIPIVARKLAGADRADSATQLPAGIRPDGLDLPASTATRRSTPTPRSSGPSASSGDDPEGGAWIPFGGGVRRCLGASFAQHEMKVVLRTVLERGPAARGARRRSEPVAQAAVHPLSWRPRSGAGRGGVARVRDPAGSRRFRQPAPQPPRHPRRAPRRSPATPASRF